MLNSCNGCVIQSENGSARQNSCYTRLPSHYYIAPIVEDGLRTAVYNKLENNWSYIEAGGIDSTKPFHEMLQFKSRLDWVS